MFFFPYGTDAPVYYFPWGTIGLIIVNVLVFFAMLSAPPEACEPYALHYGDGLHPVQWVTSNFMHGGIGHLLGNMIFLWSFALVVEGKLGPLVFVPLYLGLGIAECAIEQIVTLTFTEGASIGASSIVCGLAAMSMIWAPKNDLSCFFFAGFRHFTFEVPILGFVAFYMIGQEVLFAALNEFQISTPVLHLFGAAVGLVVGIVMLKAGWVDCENWDIFALWHDRLGEAPKKGARALRKQQAQREQQQSKNLDTARGTLRQLLRDGNGTVALALHEKQMRGEPGWQLDEPELLALLDALGKQQQSARGIPLMVEYLRRFMAREVPVRLKLAQLLLQEGRPTQATRVLQKLPDEPLEAKFEGLRKKLMAEADHQREVGAVELEAEDW
jgi:membrane associated rhomboid family serine protease